MAIFKFLKRQNDRDTTTASVEETEKRNDGFSPEDENCANKAELTPADVKPVRTADGKIFLRVRYNRSYTAKIIQSVDKLKSYYSEIKNEFSRYKVKSRVSWRYETFKTGRKLLARLSIRGKTLSLYLALDPAAYADTKYKINDVSSVAKNAEVPLLYKIKNDRRCKYAKELIAQVMQENGLEAGAEANEDYAKQYPYEPLENLVERGLVKLLKWKENASDSEESFIEISQEEYEEIADLTEEIETVESITVPEAEEQIDDEEVETFVNESEKISDKTKKAIVNVDTLGRYFNSGEEVTLEEIKKRVPSVGAKTTYIKVLARGRLDKALNVEADDFSPAAVKMIILTGGTVTRKRK